MHGESEASNPDPRAGADDELVARLASYLVETRGLDEMRRAIAIWQQEAVNAGLPVEQLLSRFKKVLLGMTPVQQSKNDGAVARSP